MTDERVTELAVSGDSAAADYLMDKYKELVRARARTLYLAGGDREDLIQEGMIGLYKAVRDYDPSQNVPFCAFAQLCINRQMYSAVKSANTQKNKPLNDYISFEQIASDDCGGAGDIWIGFEGEKKSNPEEFVIDREMTNMIEYQLVGRLSDMEREIFKYYMNDLSYDDIANKTGKSVRSVGNAMQRIKQKLCRVISETAG